MEVVKAELHKGTKAVSASNPKIKALKKHLIEEHNAKQKKHVRFVHYALDQVFIDG